MKQWYALFNWTVLALLMGCGAQLEIRDNHATHPQPVMALDWKHTLNLGTQTSSKISNCLAKEVAQFYSRYARLPGDYQRLRANGCCGPTSRFESVQCTTGTTHKLNTWLDTLPPDSRTGNIGVGHVANGKQRTLCLIRLNAASVALDETHTTRINVVTTDKSRALFGRLHTGKLGAEETPTNRRVERGVSLNVPQHTLAAELHHINQPLALPLASFLMPSTKHCGVLEPNAEHPIDTKYILNTINTQRTRVNLSPLGLNQSWQAPLSSWLERMNDRPPMQKIVGLLDSRGWMLPRVRVIRLNMFTADDFHGLIENGPSLRALISDLYMTSLSIRPFNHETGYLLAFIQEPKFSTAQAFEDAFLNQLNDYRRQLNLDSLVRLESASADKKATDCASGLDVLKETVQRTAQVQIWMKVVLSDVTDRSTPSCTINYSVQTPDID